MKKNILLQLDSDQQASTFDAVTAHDAGAEAILARAAVSPQAVRGLIHGLLFTRGGKDLRHSAAFVGGSDAAAGEALFQAARDSFFGPFRVSLMHDSNGCNTTAAAAVAKICGVTALAGKKVVVMAATGPVGQRAAGLLAQEGARVVMTSRRLDRVETACRAVTQRFGVEVSPAAADDGQSVDRVLENAHAVLCTGAAGVQLLGKIQWQDHPQLAVLADINAVPPVGAQGVEPVWDGQELHGKKLFGALGVGGLKMRVHRTCVARMFEHNDLVYDTQAIYAVAKEIAAS